MDYDDKIISAPFEVGLEVGSLFFWKRAKTDWLVYLKEDSEDAYFRGHIRKAAHVIEWKDSYGNVHATKAAIRGPVETKLRSQVKSDIDFDEPNYSLSMLVPATEETKVLKRYFKLMIAGVAWEVVADDSISQPGIIELHLKEDYKNAAEDSDTVIGGNIDRELIVNTSIDNLETVKLNMPIDLWVDVLLNGKQSPELNEDTHFNIIKGKVQFEGNQLIPVELGDLEVRITIPKVQFNHVFKLQVVADIAKDTVELDIIGDSIVKPFGKSIYTIEKYINGVSVEPEGQWRLSKNDDLFTITNVDTSSIEFTWKKSAKGSIDLEYAEGNIIKTKKIKIQSLI